MSSSRMFPFDGSCALSKDADLKISFHDGTHLKTHSCLLSLASTILRTAIEECVHNSVLNVEHDNREAWILLLNVVHPSGPILLPNTAFPSIESLETAAMLADKYKVLRLFDLVDAAVCESFKTKKRTFNGTRKDNLQNRISPSGLLFRYTLLAARYRLEKSLKACREQIQDIILRADTIRINGNLASSSPGALLAQFIIMLSQEGSSETGCSIAASILGVLDFRYL